MISAIFDGAAHVTVAGCLGAFFFKQTVVDRTSKVVKEAENVTAGLVISELCISVVVLVLASNKTARILLSKDAQPPPKHNLAELNHFAIRINCIESNHKDSDCCTSSFTSPVQNTKRLSIDSDTTLVDHCDDDFAKDFSDADHQESTFHKDDSNCSGSNLPYPGTESFTIDDPDGPSESQRMQLQPIIPRDRNRTTSAFTEVPLLVDTSTQTTTVLSESLGSISPPIVTPRLKPPDTKWHRNFRSGRYKHESRSTRLAAVRDSIKRTRTKQLEHATMIGK
ncbi:hypothetical protein BDR07DRAFT_1379122 [Suillus spraguei]|nr:hypothetical protein BDR07DRAFT_1379122 [Suillus spraguei]